MSSHGYHDHVLPLSHSLLRCDLLIILDVDMLVAAQRVDFVRWELGPNMSKEDLISSILRIVFLWKT